MGFAAQLLKDITTTYEQTGTKPIKVRLGFAAYDALRRDPDVRSVCTFGDHGRADAVAGVPLEWVRAETCYEVVPASTLTKRSPSLQAAREAAEDSLWYYRKMRGEPKVR